jgi:hypothetical protein
VLRHFQGAWDTAIDLFQASREEARRLDDHELLYDTGFSQARMLVELDRLEEAGRLLEETLDHEVDDLKFDTVGPLGLLCIVRAGQGRIEEARRLVAEIQGRASATQDRRNEPILAWCEARLALAERRWPESDAAYERLLAVCAELSLPFQQAVTLLESGDLALQRGEAGSTSQALVRYREALEIFKRIGSPGYEELTRGKLAAAAREDADPLNPVRKQ